MTFLNEKGGFFYGWVIVLTCLFSLIVASSTSQTFSAYFLPISIEFGWDRAQVSLALSANMLITAFFLPVIGKLIARYGPKRVILAGILMMGISTILLSMIHFLWQYYVLIGLGGIGFCLSGMIPGTVLIARWFHIKRATAMSIFLSGYPISQIALVPISTYLIFVYGWRFSYIFYGLFFIMIFPIILILLKDDPKELESKRDMEISNQFSDDFTSIEREISIMEALKTRSFPILIFVHALCGITDISVTAHFMPLVLDVGFSAVTSAGILSIVGVFILIGTIVTGPISDKFGRKNIASILYIIRMFSILLILGTPDIIRLYIFAILFGFSYFSMVSLFGAWIADNYGTSSLGKLNGIISSIHSIAASIGIYFLGFIYDVYKNYYWGMFIFLILSGMAALSTFLLKEKNALG